MPSGEAKSVDPRDLKNLARAREFSQNGEGRRVRQASRMKLSVVAFSIDVPVLTVSRWERGLEEPTGDGGARWGIVISMFLATEPGNRAGGTP